ncbi:hypothetical protein Mgra_00000039 [Meloidogyne graminicola]|uniref:Potassium channel domain-containing protein n=1 Tax=Meloidogyne graminicola TaxID=189291 RepID=A0A8T0A288_9BILA|nr:hypothetical protein Mgra_00000039 [Meloidogyne graminicola]
MYIYNICIVFGFKGKEEKREEKYFLIKNRRNPLIIWPTIKWLRGRQLIENLRKVNLIKKPKIPKISNKTKKQINNFGPLFLLISLFVYLLFGASAFLFLEHTNHEQIVRSFFFNLIINRNKYSKQISSTIFNGTKNMLIIVDYDSSERIQKEINNLLSNYEKQLEIKMPDLNEWTLENSLTYCWGLITTIGHGHRSPKTKGGQIFALFYCLLGVPFFVFTLIIISYRLLNLFNYIIQLLNKYNKLINLNIINYHLIVCIIYFIWLIIFSLILYLFVIPESFWRSLYTCILSSLTIQTADYNLLNEKQKLIILINSTISLLISCICIIITINGNLKNNFKQKNKNKIEEKLEEEENEIKNEIKFNIIIDENVLNISILLIQKK